MILKEAFEQFTVYKCDVSSSFLYALFDNTALFMNGLSEYLLSESNQTGALPARGAWIEIWSDPASWPAGLRRSPRISSFQVEITCICSLKLV